MAKKSSQRSPFQSIFDTYLDALFDLARRGDAVNGTMYFDLGMRYDKKRNNTTNRRNRLWKLGVKRM